MNSVTLCVYDGAVFTAWRFVHLLLLSRLSIHVCSKLTALRVRVSVDYASRAVFCAPCSRISAGAFEGRLN